eukprot:CAMPEP_0175283774 /NCGR_PEP_ID=MMETSP0093-20121207/52322_1 /TAXON_ID=311494 /ORGANISM="Alexandrium monilatum, Strain CCMP3105" /LENGTH=281 /DNA_ID=CAMNT_0016579021 /DNA_START=52 /DNA_END=898 /DNA_ORIENTATION=-
MALWHGVLLMVFRSAATSLAENLQRFAQRPERPQFVLNAVGVLLQVVSAPMDAIAYTVAPQSTLAPVSMVGLLFNLLAAQRAHGDSLARRDIAATALIIVGGCSLVHDAWRAQRGQQPLGALHGCVRELRGLATLACSILAGMLVALREVRGSSDALVNAVLGGILGSMTVVAGKVVRAAFTAPSAGFLSIVSTCLPTTVLVLVHLFVLNRGYGRHPLVFMSPVGGAAGLIANVAAGRFLYSEVPVAPLRFVSAVGLLCVGVLLFCLRGAGVSEASKRQDD